MVNVKTIGLDIGTTSVGCVVLDSDGNVTESRSLPNDAAMTSARGFERTQNAERILEICRFLLDDLIERHGNVEGIGVTGQMHGIVYIDDGGKSASPLYTWQDARGDEVFRENLRYSEWLSRVTGYKMATGYGLTTHFYLTKNGNLPEKAASFCTIADFTAMSLAGRRTPSLHPSMAASLGLYDPQKQAFDAAAITHVGMDAGFLPSVESAERIIGFYRGIPVAPALGDNQAGFLGSMNQEGRVLVNVGTGGQISICVDRPEPLDGFECRPYVQGGYLLVAASLCGGYAYHLLRDFFRGAAAMMGFDAPDDLYDRMNAAALQSTQITQTQNILDESPLVVDARFNGTRDNPRIRGSVSNISSGAFTPGQLCAGMLRGICGELHSSWQLAKERVSRPSFIVASGNGIRKNPVLRSIFASTFGLPVRVPLYTEEAACGSALFSLLLGGNFSSREELKSKIRYAEI